MIENDRHNLTKLHKKTEREILKTTDGYLLTEHDRLRAELEAQDSPPEPFRPPARSPPVAPPQPSLLLARSPPLTRSRRGRRGGVQTAP